MTKLAEKPAPSKASRLSPREDEALRLVRELARAERERPKPPPINPKRGNRYIASQ